MGWWYGLLIKDIAIMPFGAAIMKDGRITMKFPTEQEAYEYVKELEDFDNENWTDKRNGNQDQS